MAHEVVHGRSQELVFWQPFWKWQISRKFWRCRIAPLMVVTYHYVKFYVSIITISTPYHMWVENDVPNWFLTSENFYWSPFSKWLPQYRTNSTLSDFNDISYVGRLWCPIMLNFCGIVVAILKMETGRNFSMSGINSEHWNRTMLNLCGIVVDFNGNGYLQGIRHAAPYGDHFGLL
jgi:hypothetical protein